MSCSHTKHCELYVHFAADPSLNLWKQHYCEGGYERCARYQQALKGVSVPLTLLPNGKTLKWERTNEENGIHALFNAIQKNRVPMVKSILKSRLADPRGMTRDGCTPLMFAARMGNEQMVQILLDFGCNPHARNAQGDTAADIAMKEGHEGCARLIRERMAAVPPDGTDTPRPAVHQEPDADAARNERQSILHRVLGLLRRHGPERAVS